MLLLMHFLPFACMAPSAPGDLRIALEHADNTSPRPRLLPPIDPADAPEEALPEFPDLFSEPAGLREAPFTLTLQTGLYGAEIRYTRDGADPAASGEIYTGPLTIDRTTVLRAAVLVEGQEGQKQEARTWIFPADVGDQASVAAADPAAWPEVWWANESGGPWAADYEVDPEVRGAPGWPGDAAVLGALPALSVVMAPDDLFSAQYGIHENPMEEGPAWERLAFVELIGSGSPEPDFSVAAGIRSQGGSVRQASRSPKKSFRLLFKQDYGPGTLKHAIFPGSPTDAFETLVLRAGYNRSWAHWDDVGRDRADYLRERFAQDLYREMGHPAPQVRHVHLFLNGLYWGIYQIEERPDAAFFSTYLGGAQEDWDALNTGEVTDGEGAAWEALMQAVDADLSDPAACEAVFDLLDPDAFADYMLLNLYLGNIDWPDRNWWAGRNRNAAPGDPGGRWVFSTWDAEMTMSATTDDLLENDIATGLFANSPGEIFTALRACPAFRERLQARAALLLTDASGAPGLLTPAPLIARWDALADALAPAIPAESARWGDHWRDLRGDPDADLYTYDLQWTEERRRLTADYLPARAAAFLDQLRAAGLYPPE